MLSELPLSTALMALSVSIAPFVVVSAMLTVTLYGDSQYAGALPRRARRRHLPRGILWAAIGPLLHRCSCCTRLASRWSYAGFAIIIAALVWTYFNWIILLLGAQRVVLRAEPELSATRLNELRLSCADTERLALSIMYLVAERYRDGRRAPDDPGTRREALGYPGIAVARLCATLEAARSAGRDGGRVTAARRAISHRFRVLDDHHGRAHRTAAA